MSVLLYENITSALLPHQLGSEFAVGCNNQPKCTVTFNHHDASIGSEGHISVFISHTQTPHYNMIMRIDWSCPWNIRITTWATNMDPLEPRPDYTVHIPLLEWRRNWVKKAIIHQVDCPCPMTCLSSILKQKYPSIGHISWWLVSPHNSNKGFSFQTCGNVS